MPVTLLQSPPPGHEYPDLEPLDEEHLACLAQAALDDEEPDKRGEGPEGYYRWRAKRLRELGDWLADPAHVQ